MKALTVGVATVAALIVGAVLGGLLLGSESEPEDQSPEAGFARDMSVHHAQAVEMAFIVRHRTDDPEVRVMAYDMINTQRAQMGMFSGWLQQWELPQTSVRPPMQWSDHGHGEAMMESYDDMPGMASDAQLDQLREASDVEAELLFLELMIDHHRGGVEMAEAVLPLTDRSEVTYLADTIVAGQQAEVATMEDMLIARKALYDPPTS
ncbi:MAG: DUF305 domain-containing protein [Actinomycetia bacterium]|nr:DUF305 domain-containing protein [Actinomycetes bacterium]